MEYKKLSKKAKKSWFLSRLIATIIVGILLVGGVWIVNYKLEWKFTLMFKTPINVIIIIILLLLLLNTFVYPIIEYKQWEYMINEDKVDFKEGIFSVKRTIIPMIRIQHIVINEGFINRIFSLASIDIHTAGGVHTIPNLELKDAKEISEYLRAKISAKVENENDTCN